MSIGFLLVPPGVVIGRGVWKVARMSRAAGVKSWWGVRGLYGWEGYLILNLEEVGNRPWQMPANLHANPPVSAYNHLRNREGFVH